MLGGENRKGSTARKPLQLPRVCGKPIKYIALPGGLELVNKDVPKLKT